VSETEPRPRVTRRRLGVVAAGVAALAIAAGLWAGNAGRSSASSCKAQPEAARTIDQAAQGELAALEATGTGRGYADLGFTDATGAKKTIADFKGKVLLVNFWASWCIPCRKEMPALNALAGKYDGSGFEVLPINLDIGTAGLGKAKAFLEKGNWPNLPLYADSTFAAFDRLKSEAVSVGLPTSLLLDRNGCELAVLQGPAAWDTPDGERVIAALDKVTSS
jgi:thiol-disulfide isomerase/thioredoxin